MIVVMRGPGETRSALLAGDQVLEVAHRRDGALAVGAVVQGRVVGHAPGFAFVDVGTATPGVLKVKAPLVEGSLLPVSIAVPPRGEKGAELKQAEKIADAPDPVSLWLARYESTIAEIHINPSREALRLQRLLPGTPVVAAVADPFSAYGIEDAIEAALTVVADIPGGGRLTIEPTAAAILIDIDGGPLPPAAANAAAIPVIARELRLRNLAGHILIDVIPGARGAARAFAEELAATLADDPTPSQVAGVTPLGMVELTRRRDGLSLAETLADSVATTAYAALRRAVITAFQARTAAVVIRAPASVIDRLQTTLRGALTEAEDLAHCSIVLEKQPDGAQSLDVYQAN
jgi:Ribonuclease G/E